MTLDVFKVSSQLHRMGQELQSLQEERYRQLQRAREAFSRFSADWERLADLARSSERSAAAPLGPLDTAVLCTRAPSSYEVLATDGSTIEPDRHGPAMCALVNVGRVRIRYGTDPRAELDTQPTLYHRPEDLYVEQGGRRILLRERLLDARRSLAEMTALSEMAEEPDEFSVPRVALADGLLTIWRDDWATQNGAEVISQFNHALERLAACHMPLAAYVSNPSSHWVVDLLRAGARCGAECRLDCAEAGCAFKGLVDVQLYSRLQPGERSGLFEMVGSDQQHYAEDVRAHFFYLNAVRETVRIEVPAWVARDEQALALVHNVVMDQAERGQGYPVALARAHEQAVLSGRDRQVFQQLMVESLTRAGLAAEISEKQASKNLRAV